MKHRLMLLPVLCVAMTALFAASAQAATPAPGYAQFTGCPSPAEDSSVEICISSTIKSGHFQMGSKNVPISKPMRLTGGTDAEFGNFTANSEGGLKPVKQEVPGGVIGITGLDWLVNFLSLEQLKLYAVTEMVGTPDITPNLISIPVRARLVNPVLGNNCFVGSASNPIELVLTTETTNPPPPNKPIKGVEPTLEFLPGEIIRLRDGTYVDNAFAAPGADGCVLTLLGLLPIDLDPLVNLQASLPSAAGRNETSQTIDTEAVEPAFVYP